MPLEVGAKAPNATLVEMTAEGPQSVESEALFKGRKIALFAVPGAYTPTCSNAHLPSFVKAAAALSEKGVDEIICVAVNDPFVMSAWGKDTGATDAGIRMLSDPEAHFTKAMGLDFSAAAVGLIDRSQRYSMLLDDGVIKILNIEGSPGEATCSVGEVLVEQI